MAGTQVTESSLLPWDVDAAAVNSTSQTSSQRLRKSRSLAHKDTLQVNGRAGAVQPHGLGHNDGAARFLLVRPQHFLSLSSGNLWKAARVVMPWLENVPGSARSLWR